ncbi:hypothetical protein MNEG_2539 [Monoraphidium neglectum]|uniref:PWWP domain-containing protein n=1 Tax=Monoraphidium neglectum TaxID=145388 RepID=A0A0D2K4N0_9CHLO|nr:hypothetical protein MNEG_2539 [Monoraphidium neglectum]KIZ05418.1 hypothetical protein MNEG_2539 [Monoraphidium neglectum]|eukprot:XP_013904437.1 hypothetical protein MNEG_2539 [Monoraphidium neglectum]
MSAGYARCQRPEDKEVFAAEGQVRPLIRDSYACDGTNQASLPSVDHVDGLPCEGGVCLLLNSGAFGMLRVEDAERLQALPEGHTRPCYPIQSPGVGQHRATVSRDQEAQALERRRLALIAAATNVRVARWLGERLARPCGAKYLQSARDVPLPTEMQSPSLDDGQLLEAWQLRDDALHGRGAASGEGLLVHQARQRRRQQRQQQTHQRQQKQKRLHRKRQRQDGAGGVAAAPTHEDAVPENDDDGGDENGEAGVEQDEDTCDAVLAARSAAISSFEEGSQTWPQAAWYLAGQGRFCAGDLSESPVKESFIPLADFIDKVGRLPDGLSLQGFVKHLKDKGLDMRRAEQQLLGTCPPQGRPASALAGAAAAGADAEAAALRERMAACVGVLAWGRVPLPLPQVTAEIQAAWAARPAAPAPAPQAQAQAVLTAGHRIAQLQAHLQMQLAWAARSRARGGGGGGGAGGEAHGFATTPLLFREWGAPPAFKPALPDEALSATHREARKKLLEAFMPAADGAGNPASGGEAAGAAAGGAWRGNRASPFAAMELAWRGTAPAAAGKGGGVARSGGDFGGSGSADPMQQREMPPRSNTMQSREEQRQERAEQRQVEQQQVEQRHAEKGQVAQRPDAPLLAFEERLTRQPGETDEGGTGEAGADKDTDRPASRAQDTGNTQMETAEERYGTPLHQPGTLGCRGNGLCSEAFEARREQLPFEQPPGIEVRTAGLPREGAAAVAADAAHRAKPTDGKASDGRAEAGEGPAAEVQALDGLATGDDAAGLALSLVRREPLDPPAALAEDNTAAAAVGAAAADRSGGTAATADDDGGGGGAQGPAAAARDEPPAPSAADPESPGLWWPCEVVDPWAPPDKFELRLQHLLALAPADRAASVPPSQLRRLLGILHFHPALAVAATEAAEGTQGGAAGSDPWGSAAAADPRAPPPEGRLLLVLWFGTGSFEWRPGQELLPFSEYRKHMEAHARLLQAEGLLPRTYPAALAEAVGAAKLQGGFRGRGKHLLMKPADLARMVSGARPPPLPEAPSAGLALLDAARLQLAAAARRDALLLRAAQQAPLLPRLFAPQAAGGGSGGGRAAGGAGSGGLTRAPQVLPNIQRCGECRTCLNRQLKKACLRNKLIRTEMVKVVTGTGAPHTPGNLPTPSAMVATAANAGSDAEPTSKRSAQLMLPAPPGAPAAGGVGHNTNAGSMGALMSAVAARGLELEIKGDAFALKLPPSRAPQALRDAMLRATASGTPLPPELAAAAAACTQAPGTSSGQQQQQPLLLQAPPGTHERQRALREARVQQQLLRAAHARVLDDDGWSDGEQGQAHLVEQEAEEQQQAEQQQVEQQQAEQQLQQQQQQQQQQQRQQEQQEEEQQQEEQHQEEQQQEEQQEEEDRQAEEDRQQHQHHLQQEQRRQPHQPQLQQPSPRERPDQQQEDGLPTTGGDEQLMPSAAQLADEQHMHGHVAVAAARAAAATATATAPAGAAAEAAEGDFDDYDDALLAPLFSRKTLGDGGGRGAGGRRFVPPLAGGAEALSEGAVPLDAKQRCMQCEACTQSVGNQQHRCLQRRAREAAAAGSEGAWLAAHGAGAVGARISVWWPLDEAWYDGVVVDYDPLQVRHTVAYDDNDTEILRLWDANQQVHVTSPPEEWPQEAARPANKRVQAAAQVAAAQAAARLAAVSRQGA